MQFDTFRRRTTVRDLGTLAIDALEHRYDNSVSDVELLEVLVATLDPRSDAATITMNLFDRFDCYSEILSAPIDLLIQVPGVNRDLAARLRLTKYAAQRFARDQVTTRKTLVSSSSALLEYCAKAMAYEPIEHFRVLFLNSRNRLIADEELARGTVNHVPVYSREVMRRAIVHRAAGLILVHNHPSGDPAPSSQDVQITKELVSTARPLGITIHDHIIVGRYGHKSLKQLSLM